MVDSKKETLRSFKTEFCVKKNTFFFLLIKFFPLLKKHPNMKDMVEVLVVTYNYMHFFL